MAGEGPCEWGETCCCNAGDQRCKEIEGRAAEDESDHFYIQYGVWAQVWGKSAFLSGGKMYHMTRQDLPGRDQVDQERLQQLLARAPRGGLLSPPPPPLLPTVDEWLQPKVFLSPGPSKPALAGWAPWMLSQGTLHTPLGSSLAGPGPDPIEWYPLIILSRCSTASLRRRQLNRSTPPSTTCGGVAHPRSDAYKSNRISGLATKLPHVQTSALGVPLPVDSTGPEARYCSARHWRDTLLHLRSSGRGARPPSLGTAGPHACHDGCHRGTTETLRCSALPWGKPRLSITAILGKAPVVRAGNTGTISFSLRGHERAYYQGGKVIRLCMRRMTAGCGTSTTGR